MGPHLIHKAMHKYPRILDATYEVALGIRKELTVTGETFPTKDGSAQRDYIHVSGFACRIASAARALVISRTRARVPLVVSAEACMHTSTSHDLS